MTGSDGGDERIRGVAFGVAYRMLGSVADAEDVAQEAVIRLLAADPAPEEPAAWITTVATRLAIDVLRSARVRRERYVGDWLPEPLVAPFPGGESRGLSGPAAADAAEHAELADDLSFAFLVLLETLTPTERAAFLLHDVLDYSYAETASALERPSEAAVRQLVARARAHIAERRPRFSASPGAQASLVQAFLEACESGAVESFVSLLTEDVVFTGDGGGKVPPGFAISRPVHGREAAAKLLATFARRATFAVRLEPALVNGGPGMLILADLPVGGGLIGVWAFDVRDGRIAAIDGVINPEKLRHLAPLADLDALRRAMAAPARGIPLSE